MKQVLFLGACDKTDLLLAVCKVLAKAECKVLLVDGTAEQIYTYSVPTIDCGYQVTEYEEFDVAHDFFSYHSLQEYFESQKENLSAYDYILIDTDVPDSVNQWPNTLHHVLVTSFEKSCVQKNIQLVKRFFETRDKTPFRFFKLIVQAVEGSINEEYVESTLADYPIQWTDPSYAVFLDELDYRAKIENQFYNRLHLKPFTKDYKRTVLEIAQLVSELELDDKALNKAMKLAERRK